MTGALFCLSFLTLDSVVFHYRKPDWKPFAYAAYLTGGVEAVLLVYYFISLV